MSAASDSIQLAGDIFIVCMILTVGIVCGRMSNQMSQASNTVINQNTVEYLEAAIADLAGNTHTGAAVKQYVNKYRRKMTIQVATMKSVGSSADPLKIDSTTSVGDISDENSIYFVANDAMFECVPERDSNGNYYLLNFVQVGASNVSAPGGAYPDDALGAKSFIIDLIGGNSTMDWDDITKQLDLYYADNGVAKDKLVNAVGPGVDANSTMESVADAATKQLKDQKEQLSNVLGQAQYKQARYGVYGNQSITIDSADLEVVIVTDSSRRHFVWSKDAGWINGEPNLTIAGNTITNNENDTSYDFICYYKEN